ncbi:MAG: tetratricopeptide repeat protein [Rhodospirillaceae bacterium]|nr:tetratricopeptide repeat protein [Rhodospirillaceae bacterium]
MTDHLAAGKAAYLEWRFDEAEAALGFALEAESNHFEAKVYLARTLEGQGRLVDAIALYQDALTLQPDHAATHLLLAQALLTDGQYAEGWEAYEWRYRGESGQPFPEIDAPRWQGEALDSKTLLVIAEQGHGDVMQFIRLLPQIKQRGGQVSLACSGPLKRLMANCEAIDHLFQDWHRAGAFDCYCPLSSLPGVLSITLENLPNQVPYITADARLAKRWPRRLGVSETKRIGLCWAGRPTHPNDAYRSLPFEKLDAALPDGPEYISLQKGERAADAADSRLRDFGSQLHDFADTAALIEALDLVITVDTSVAHLAGAMGKPVWVLLPYVPDWRWGRDIDTTPWYPTARLFRQIEPGDWGSVLDAVAAAL